MVEPFSDEKEQMVRMAPHRVRIDAWALVLSALGIPHRIVHLRGEPQLGEGAPPAEGFGLLVPASDLRRAAIALANTDAEDAERAHTPETKPPDHGRPLVPVLVCIALALFFLVTGPRAGHGRWFAVGSAEAAAIMSGAWWRAVTGMTLHADVMHLAGNVVAMLVFLSAVSRWLGGGWAVALMMLAGFAGNLTTAATYGSHHNSVGASTATFAALGLLGGLQARHRVRHGWWHRSRRIGRAWPAVAACLALFAMLGVGGEDRSVDVVAHATGLGWGLLLGAVAAWLPRSGRAVNAALAAGSLAAVVACWLIGWRP